VLKPAVSGFEKNSSYECGFEPFVCKNEVFESHFLVVGVLFLLFDLELIFLFPLGVVAPTYDYTVPLAVFPFLMVLLLGFVFE
jgi:NADH-quinone oxidoreductase subunit A